jgi:hypothetical protein
MKEALDVLFYGDAHRHFKKMPLNQDASVGHAVFQIFLKQTTQVPCSDGRGGTETVTKRRTINFIDLATFSDSDYPDHEKTPIVNRAMYTLLSSNKELQRALAMD